MNVMRTLAAVSLALGVATQTSAALSARSYVREGLVGQWDGEENAGFGVHDATSEKWADLSGHYQSTKGVPLVTLPDDAQVLEKSVRMTRTQGCPTNNPSLSSPSGKAGYDSGLFGQAFVDARYSVEVAFNMAEDDVTARKVMTSRRRRAPSS